MKRYHGLASLFTAGTLLGLINSALALPQPKVDCPNGFYEHPFLGCVPSCDSPFVAVGSACQLQCGPAEQPNDDGSDCIGNCQPNFFPNDSRQSCVPCPNGSSSDGTAYNCDEDEVPVDDCEAGMIRKPNGSCGCADGWYYSPDGGCLIQCSDPFIQDEWGTSCVCPDGEYQVDESTCDFIPSAPTCQGDFKPVGPNGECQCPPGKVVDSVEDSSCASTGFLLCLGDKQPGPNGGCVCPSGTVEGDNDTCNTVPEAVTCPGDFKPVGPNGECQCPPGKVVDSVEDSSCASTGFLLCLGDKQPGPNGGCVCPSGTVEGDNDICNTAPAPVTCPIANEVSENGACVCKSPFYTSGDQCLQRPLTVPTVPDWEYKGCWSDSVAKRTLQGGYQAGDSNSIPTCLAYCAQNGFKYAGVEYSGECFCSAKITDGAEEKSVADCSMPCKADQSQPCGGPDRLDLFESTVLANAPASAPSVAAGSSGFEYLGCYTDSVASRTLPQGMGVPGGGAAMTAELCLQACANGGYTYAGLEYSGECYCGTSLPLGKEASDGEAQCNMLCNGNKNEICGGPDRLTLYKSTTPATGATVILPNGWTDDGCYTDKVSARTLAEGVQVPGGSGAMTVELCIATCASEGFAIAGLEYAQECWCGNGFSNGGGRATDGCNMPCKGKPTQTCGGPDRLNVYTMNVQGGN